MNSGDFTERIAIEAPTESRTESGAFMTVWVTFGSRFARIENAGGREVFIARQSMPEVDAIIKLPGYLAITPKMRVRHDDGRKWDILAVLPQAGKSALNAEVIHLRCKEGIRQGS